MWSFNELLDVGTRWLRAIAQGSTLLGVFMIGLLWTSLSFHLNAEHTNAERAAIQNSANLARAFEEHLSRSIKDIDRSLKIMRSRYVQYPNELDFRNWLRNSQLFDDQTVQVAVIGPDGVLVLSSIDAPSSPKTDLSDREHFRVQLDAKSDDLFISKPVIGRTSGKWSVQLARRIENGDGSFGGVVVASLDPAYLSRFYGSVDTGVDGFIRVVGTDGIIRAAGGRAPDLIGKDLSRGIIFKRYPKETTGWFYTVSNLSDNISRLIVYRAVKDYPLIIAVGLSSAEIFSGANAGWGRYNLVAAVLTLLILVVMGFSIRGRLLLKRTRRFLDTIIENVPVPIVVKEPHTNKFVLVNQAYEAFVGLPRDRLIGSTVFDFFPPKDAEMIAQYDDEAVKFNKRLISADFPVKTPANGPRIVTTTRLVVCDGNDKPQCLIAVIEDITEKKKAEAEIAYMAHHDPLTGLANRARFAERLDDALTRVRRGGKLAVHFLDLDRFKDVNDTLGHPVGDELLKVVAERLRGGVRETDTVARLGGDEFAIIQTAVKQPEDILVLANRIREVIKAPYDLNGLQAAVGVSIGISTAPNDATNTAELMKRADMALYKAKAEGRGTYRFFEPEMDDRMQTRRKLEGELRNAIVKGEFELFYQPVVDIDDNRIVGLEALLRWHHPQRGIISPAEIIPIAEETGLIVPIGEWVIGRACADAALWPDDIKIAANLSPAQFRSPNLVPVVTDALAASGMPPSRLELEITEEFLLGQNQDNLAVLNRLRGLGVQIVMDDFGTGYSSLNYLRCFPFDKIKIDHSFVNNLAEGDDLSLAVVQAVARLAGALKVPTTAEGVETKEQWELVRAAGCTEFQGYYFCPPKPAAEIARLFFPSAAAA